ncbi:MULTISPECIES: hypothetical protein [Vibrio]|uniref:hypothetical protein n=1 Tax=Vibrio TaxID=662 RepID=UPI00057CA0CE|nr:MULTISPECIES: hypothetical protein [Vibrio]KIE18854.1 hypothetical protein SE23_20115 [Vibrio sinaloensis]MBF4453668.1 hypothetical protein [Vibrio vulnificus]MBF4499446.1 hypothetical protein [Vibrio vulnificus]MBL6179017.1 hypothetical protein [Vibrio vulnificus]HDY7983728.1 hypothetical protein [Vibrio vulnificus]
MSVKVDGHTVIASETLLIQDGQDAWVEFMALDWHVQLKIVLERTDNRNTQAVANISASPDNQSGVLTLSNFGGEGTSFSPFKIGETEGRDVYVSALGHSVADVTQIVLQFSLQGEN